MIWRLFRKRSVPDNLPKISVSLITTNEAGVIRQWLDNISLLHPYEIIVVEDHSKDGTLDIIRSYADKLKIGLHRHSWSGSFSEQRNFAKKLCSGDWILSLDADETLLPQSFNLIPRLTLDDACLAYCFPRLAVFPDKDHYIGKPNGDLQLRLFRNLPEIQYIHKIHEWPAYHNREIHPGLIRTKSGWKWCRIAKKIKILHWVYLKPYADLIEKGRDRLKYKVESKQRGCEIKDEKMYILDKKHFKSHALKELLK